MKYFFSVLLFVIPFLLQGQEIKVNVVFKNEPLPYTYISVNRTPIAITNASGIARIPMDKINLGDTITSSMIGMLSVSLIYDQQTQQHQECELVHTTEVAYDLGEVTAIGYSDRSSRRIFSRVATTHIALQQNFLVSGNFTSTITLSDGTAYPVNGAFVIENNIPKRTSNREFFRFYFNIPAQIETKSDTTNLSRELQESIRYIYRETCGILIQLHREHRGLLPHSSISYLGLKEGRHFFSYANSSPELIGAVQVLFETDADSQELTNAKYTTFNLGDNHTNLTINVLCEKLSNVPPRNRTTITVPKNIEANIIRPNGTIIDLKLDNISIKFQ